jgi:uncharacterized membrane protein
MESHSEAGRWPEQWDRRHPERRARGRSGRRWMSAAAGAALVAYGLRTEGKGGAPVTLAGGLLLYRTFAGKWPAAPGATLYAPERAQTERATHVERSVTINRPIGDVYRFFRDLENLPSFMQHLRSVRADGRRSHWVATGPAGMKVEWDAEITGEIENERLAWRSVEGSDVFNEGSVRFDRTPQGRETVVHVSLRYDPPGGRAGAMLAKLFGEEPSQQITEDLRRLKRLLEAGEIPTVEGQPRGA